MGTNARSDAFGISALRSKHDYYSKKVDRASGLFCSSTPQVIVLLIVLLISLPAKTQVSQPREAVLIHGYVTDTQGEPLFLATVEMRDLSGVSIGTSLTDSAGSFAIATLAQPGEYVLLASKQMKMRDERITLHQSDLEVKIALPAGPTKIAAEGPTDYAVSVQQLRVPEKVRMHLKLASQRFAKLNITGAQREVERALQIDDSCPAVFSMRAFLRIASRNLKGAVDDAGRAALLDPFDANAYLAQASAYNALTRFQNAEEASRQALRLRPDLWQAQLELAKALLGQRRFVLAWRELDELNRDFPDIHLVRANVLVGLNRQREAAQEFSRFLQEAPNDPRNQQVQQIVARLAESRGP